MPIDGWAIFWWLIHTVVASGVAILAFLGITSTKIGERFLSHHLDRKLTAFKHEHNKEIEGLKAQLAHLDDRGKRSNEREYNALTEIWEKFVDAYLSTQNCIHAFMEFPDLNKLSDVDLRTYLGTTDLSDTQRESVIRANDKVDVFSKTVRQRQIRKAGGDIFDARMLLRKKGVFVPDNISRLVQASLDVLLSAQVEQHMEIRHGFREGKSSLRLIQNGDKMFDELGAAMKTRLLATL
jgi:hypothetical protein